MYNEAIVAILENSVEEFVERFASYAVQGTLYPQPEGGVLLEFLAKGMVLYLFDRTGPYTAKTGAAKVIVHPVLDVLESSPSQEEFLECSGISQVQGVGKILHKEKHFVILQAHILLVCGIHQPIHHAVGDWVSFKSISPVHGFYVGHGAK